MDVLWKEWTCFHSKNENKLQRERELRRSENKLQTLCRDLGCKWLIGFPFKNTKSDAVGVNTNLPDTPCSQWDIKAGLFRFYWLHQESLQKVKTKYCVVLCAGSVCEARPSFEDGKMDCVVGKVKYSFISFGEKWFNQSSCFAISMCFTHLI